jgi:Rrf2 family protein
VGVRISMKADYAVQAMAELATSSDGAPMKAERIARSHDIPGKFLLAIMNGLKRAQLVRSQRGPDGGYSLSRPADEITVADVIRAIDGPLADVHDESLGSMSYAGAAEPLKEVWMAVRASLRSVLESVTLRDLAKGRLPARVRSLAETYQADNRSTARTRKR